MGIAALIILIFWGIFIVAYIAVRTVFPDLAKGNRRISQIKKATRYDDEGYDRNGWSALGFHRNGTRYDDNGYDRFGNRKPADARTDLPLHEPLGPSDFDFDTEEGKD